MGVSPDAREPLALAEDTEGKALVGAALTAAGAFFGNVAAYVRELFLAGSLTLLGPADLTPADLAVIEAQVNVQQGYLTSFEMEAAAADALDGNFAARAESYAASLWGNAQGTARQRIIDGGLAVEERRVHEGSDPPCQDCDDMIAEGWVAVGTLPDIGDSQCMFNCHCHFEYRSDVAPEPLLSVFDLIASQSPYAGIEDDFGTIMLGPEPVAAAPAAPPPARAPRPVAPAPPPAPPPAVQPGGVPVSAALNVEVPGAFGQRLESAIAAIDSVHGDGNLPAIPINTAAMQVGRSGQIGINSAGVPQFINISESGFYPELALVHEIGHDLEYGALRGLPGSDALMAPVQAALRNSAAAQELARLATVESVPATGLDLAGVTRSFNLPIDQAHVAYISSNDELWARSYAQYIAIRSGDTTLLDQLNVRRGPGPLSFRYPEQWSDQDFAPIASAIDAMFQRLGWLH